jgi:hypothetical protein
MPDRRELSAKEELGPHREEVEALFDALAVAGPRILVTLDHTIAQAEDAVRALRDRRS